MKLHTQGLVREILVGNHITGQWEQLLWRAQVTLKWASKKRLTKGSFFGRHRKLCLSVKIGYVKLGWWEEKNQRSSYKGPFSGRAWNKTMRLSVTQSSKTGLKREQVSRQRVARRRKKFLCFDFDREAWNSWRVCAGQQLNLCRKLAGLYDQLFVRCHQRSVCKFPTFRRIRASLASTVNNATTTQRNLSAGFSKSTISFSQRRLLFFKVQRHAASSCQRRTLWICCSMSVAHSCRRHFVFAWIIFTFRFPFLPILLFPCAALRWKISNISS